MERLHAIALKFGAPEKFPESSYLGPTLRSADLFGLRLGPEISIFSRDAEACGPWTTL